MAAGPETGFAVKDSGERAKFASGMVRDTDTDKTDTELIFNGPMADRWAAHLTKGAKKYPDVRLGVPNWTLAEGDAELIRFRKSAVRHFRQWLRGDWDEDHAAAVFFNINGYEYVKNKMGGPAPTLPVLVGYEYVTDKLLSSCPGDGCKGCAQCRSSAKLSDAALKQEPKKAEGGWTCPDCDKFYPGWTTGERCYERKAA